MKYVRLLLLVGLFAAVPFCVGCDDKPSCCSCCSCCKCCKCCDNCGSCCKCGDACKCNAETCPAK